MVFQGRGRGGQGSRGVGWRVDWCGGGFGECFEVEGIILQQSGVAGREEGTCFPMIAMHDIRGWCDIEEWSKKVVVTIFKGRGPSAVLAAPTISTGHLL